ncbi:MAG: gamma carbonic anhydrase family protein [Acidimicrobiales bacterium]|nr:gamma carbonic anhydrase family protein [Acidimicrobiales bacterium]
MAIYALGDLTPRIHPDAFVHPDATVIGDVVLGAFSSVWPSAVLRGDDGPITIGERTSIQDGVVVHTWEENPTTIGSNVVVGHLAHIEGADIEDNVLLGSTSVLLRRVRVESWALVGAGALVPPGKVVPSGALAVGIPCVIKEGAADRATIIESIDAYVDRVHRYRAGLRRID